MVFHEFTRGLPHSAVGLISEGTEVLVSSGVWVSSAPPDPIDTVRITLKYCIVYGIHPTAQAVSFLPAMRVNSAGPDAVSSAFASSAICCFG
jgi:hypothetical protein